MADPEFYLGAFKMPGGSWQTTKFSDGACIGHLSDRDMKVGQLAATSYLKLQLHQQSQRMLSSNHDMEHHGLCWLPASTMTMVSIRLAGDCKVGALHNKRHTL